MNRVTADTDAAPPIINVVALIKGPEKYVWLYTAENRAEALRSIGRFASNPELSFTWYDAACVSKRIRNEEGGNDRG